MKEIFLKSIYACQSPWICKALNFQKFVASVNLSPETNNLALEKLMVEKKHCNALFKKCSLF